MIKDHATAVQTLVSQPRCTDAAVDFLAKLAEGGDGRVLSDLSAAHYVRAQRKDQPAGLLPALDAAERAVAAAPQLPEARFNRALAQEALRLSSNALQSWDEVRRLGEDGWATEAGEHRDRLLRESSARANARWSGSRRMLVEAVRVGDRSTVRRLVEPFPAAAQKYLEDEVLPAWARASASQRPDEARQQLELAMSIASEVARATHDHYILNAVQVIAATMDAAKLRALQDGHIALQQGRLGQAAHSAQAAAHYKRAADAFAEAGSPLWMGARIGLAIADFITHHDAAHARSMLPDAGTRAQYSNISMRVASNSANFLFYESRHETLAQYDIAIDYARRMGDRENLANFHTRKAGILRVLGNKDAAWREALQALRLETWVTDAGSRHHLLGEAASVALQQGFAGVALLYQNKAIGFLEAELDRARQAHKENAGSLQNNLATAFRNRAQIQLYLSRHAAAQQDLDRAIRLATSQTKMDPVARNALLARIHEVDGQHALRSNEPARAISAFTEALARLFPGEYRTYRAMLFAERADAYTRLGRHGEAERDLGVAIEHIRAEEQLLLERRKRGDAEALWPGYFSRPRDVYERLIRVLVEHGRVAEAFGYAEKARAFEPLTLAIDIDVVPETIARWTRRGDTLPLEAIRSSLPQGTVVVEYYLLDDRLYVWLVSRDYFEWIAQPLRRDVVDGWGKAVQRHAAEGNAAALRATLEEAFEGLAAAPLARIRSRARAGERLKLVFVPDRSIYGLPLAALHDRASSRFLIQDFPVSIAASATFYVFSLARDKELAAAGSRSVLLIADPQFDAKLAVARDLDRLQWAQSEATRIGALYDSPVVREGAQATVDEFLDLVQESAVVHFAGHAVANPDAPFRSLLLFAPSHDHSGVLDAQELLTRLLPGKTRLCVLAACSSAGQGPIGPEGLAPLVRPLIAAGIPAVVGTLWDVRDATSEEIFVAFHRHYRNGRDADDALRMAQLELMNSENASLSSILAWAPVQVVGQASSPFPKSGNQQKEE